MRAELPTQEPPAASVRRDPCSDRSVAWLLTSGVIRPDGAATAWQCPEDPGREFVSAEITAYAVSFFVWLGELTAAERSARWLVTHARDDDGAFRCRWYAQAASVPEFSHVGELRWTFDTGIAVKALVDVYTATGLPDFRDAAIAAVEWLLRIRRPDGRFPGRWNTARRSPADDMARWSAQPGAYQAKIDRSIAAAALRFRRPDLLAELRERVDGYIADFQMEDGRFVSYPATGGVHAHPHLYCCEGLWSLGVLLDEPRWVGRARLGVQWLADRTDRTGACPRTWFDGQPNYAGRCDVAAQYLRMLAIFGGGGAARAAAPLHEYRRADGAFVFGWNADGSRNGHPDAWGTMAAVQALAWYGGLEVDALGLI